MRFTMYASYDGEVHLPYSGSENGVGIQALRAEQHVFRGTEPSFPYGRPDPV
ncbi:MAG: hypothetical protein LIP08_13265 [Bacteroides sp.]|nr:hypothetical protein [Bacteroides sp.]